MDEKRIPEFVQTVVGSVLADCFETCEPIFNRKERNLPLTKHDARTFVLYRSKIIFLKAFLLVLGKEGHPELFVSSLETELERRGLFGIGIISLDSFQSFSPHQAIDLDDSSDSFGLIDGRIEFDDELHKSEIRRECQEISRITLLKAESILGIGADKTGFWRKLKAVAFYGVLAIWSLFVLACVTFYWSIRDMVTN